jgi:glycosyltransferase involved in cell wall biosynthesis
MSLKKHEIFIDALSIVPNHLSGVGHNTLELIKAINQTAKDQESPQINLVVPLWKRQALVKYKFDTRIRIKTVPLPARGMELLLRLNLLPPVDLFLGKGTYIFPNYRNWPLLKSNSYTYIHDTVFMRYPEFVQPRNLFYLQKYILRWIKRADKIITLSEFSKAELIKYFQIPESKITIIFCGVDTNVFYKRPKDEIEKIKLKYDIEALNYVLYLGNIEPRKNLARLVKAFDALPLDIKKTYALVIVGGDGWLNEEIYAVLDKARDNGSVILKPKKYVADEDLPALISGASLLAHPAIYEGFGLSPLQAMACGVPVITSNTSAIPEVVGKAAILVDPLNVTSISNAIQRVLRDEHLRENLSKAGIHQAHKFSWERSASKLLSTVGQ